MCSMLSGQCDELRRIADKDTVPYEASDAMYLAADTIWELRCRLADTVDQRDEIERLESENAKLREIIDDITEVVEVSDPALVEFIAKRMQRVRIEVTDD